jgi:hypothetical protein
MDAVNGDIWEKLSGLFFENGVARLGPFFAERVSV